MKDAINIVRAASTDTPVVKALFREIEAESQPGDPAAQDAAESGFDRSVSYFDFRTSDSFWLLIAQCDGKAAGYATLIRMPKADSRVAVLYLDELHVLRPYRRRGVASALIREAEAIAREIKAWRLRLLVNPKNEAARKLYEAAGFTLSELIFCQKPT